MSNKYDKIQDVYRENDASGISFVDLDDAPSSYTGEALKAVRVNAGQTALEFYTPTDANDAAIWGNIIGTLSNQTDLQNALDAKTDVKVKYDAFDPTAGYLGAKVVAGEGITISEGTGTDENKVKISTTWLLDPVEEHWDITEGLPVAPEEGDRYISDGTDEGLGWYDGYIYEWDGEEWEETLPIEGMMVWLIFEMVWWVFFSGGWMEVGEDSYLKLDQTTAQTITASPVMNWLTASKVVFTDANKKLTSTGIGTSAQFIKGDGSLDSATYLTSVTAHDLLSTTHGDTTASAVSRGSVITGQGETPKWAELALGTVGKVLISDGTDIVWSTALGTAAYTATTAYAAADHDTTHAVGGTDTVFPADPGADKYLKWDDDPGALVWADAPALEGTAVLSTGEAGGTKFLREDGDGTCSWQTVSATDTTKATKALDNLASVAISETLVSDTDNTDALGTTAIAWSDLFLGSGAVITFNSAPSTADVTITHSANALAFAGGTVSFDTAPTVGVAAILYSGGALGTPSGGTVTNLTGTASININGTVGATSPTTVVGTTITANTGLMPDANDGAYIGASGTAFSDLFLADGGVINWNAGNATLTHSAGLLTSNVPLSLGTSNAFTCGSIELGAASDCTITRTGAGAIAVESVAVPTISSTSTLTNKRITQRVVTTTDDATAVIDVDTTDVYELSAVANATTFSTTGTPTDGQKLMIRFKDAGAGKGLTWDAVFVAIGVTLPTTTVASKWHYVGCQYNSAATKWHAIAVGAEA